MRNENQPAFAHEIAKGVLDYYKMPEKSSSPEAVYNLLRDEMLLDGNERQNLATFCTTWTEEEVDALMKAGSVKNMIDKELYPESADIEQRCIHILADLWNSPSPKETIGTSCVGSSEAAMLGGLALKWNWRLKRQAKGLDVSKPNLVTGPVQICWKKFCRYFDVEHREVPIRDNAVGATPEDMVSYCDENTIGVVPTFGITFTCAYEDVAGLSKALDKLQKEKGLDINMHVDAASGAFIAPFIEDQKSIVWDFRLPRVKSINASGHKYGLAPLGMGWVVWREKQDLPEELIFYVNYLGGNMPTFALNFSRPAGQIIAQYYLFLRLGKEGYQEIQETCMKTAQYLADELAKIPEFEILYNGRGGLPATSFKLKDGNHKFNLFEVVERIKMRGWQAAAYPLPKSREKTIIMRILIRQGISTNMASLLVKDIKNAIATLSSR
jgi:glutamate decarboxylase